MVGSELGVNTIRAQTHPALSQCFRLGGVGDSFLAPFGLLALLQHHSMQLLYDHSVPTI